MLLQHTEAWSRCDQLRYLHVSGGEVNISFELLTKRPDNGKTDAFVTACYHGDLGGHVCSRKDSQSMNSKKTNEQ